MTTRLLGLVCALGASLVFAGSKPDATLSDLQTAFQGESNAQARYLAFAEKADVEGHGGVASLFRAAARAEQIHAGNHAVVIKQFGAEPKAKIENPVIASTDENLRAAIRGEVYERDQMYPGFIKQATNAGASNAVETFQFALAAEAGHARLYAEALTKLDSMTSAVAYYVCPVCGFTASDPAMEECPTCATPKNQFAQVS